MSTIKVNNLTKCYGKVKAVDGISFEVKKGEIYGFLGPNGAGKTTTIRCMMDFLRPDSGVIKILGKNAQLRSVEIKKSVGFLPGEVHLYENWTGWDHINFIRGVRGEKDRAEELIEKLLFNPNRKFKKLSSGNKQKLGLILALMHDPEILILDEPTTALDPLLQRTVHEILRERAKSGVTVFFSSHNLPEVEKNCNKVCILREGKVVGIENVHELKKKRLYTLEAHFKNVIPENELSKFNGDYVEVLDVFDNGVTLNVKGNINPVIKLLNKYEVTDLEIEHADLENILFEFYR